MIIFAIYASHDRDLTDRYALKVNLRSRGCDRIAREIDYVYSVRVARRMRILRGLDFDLYSYLV